MTYIAELWNMQWLTSVSVILATLGALYTTCSYLDKKFDNTKLHTIKTITDGFVIGITIALLFIFFSLISIVLNELLRTVLPSISYEKEILPTPDTSTNFGIVIPGGLIIGVVLGVLYNILREKKKESTFYRHLFFAGFVGFILMFCCSIGLVEWSLSPALFSSHQILYSLLFYSIGDIGGCLFGIAVTQSRQAMWKNLLVFFCLFLVLTLLFLLFNSHGDFIYKDVLEGIFYYSQLGVFVGIGIYKWSQPRTDFKKVSWIDFISWLAVGGIIVPLLLLAVLNINESNKSFIYFILHYSLLIGAIGGQGDKIIKYVKYRGRFKDGHISPQINWKRFLYGLLVGILYVTPVILFTLLTDGLLRRPPGLILSNLLQNVDFAVLVGLMIGFIYGFGPYIIDRVDSLDERYLVRIGIVLTIGGIVIPAIFH